MAVTPTLQEAGRKHPLPAFCCERVCLLNNKNQASNSTTKESIIAYMKKSNPIVDEKEKSTTTTTSTTRRRRVTFAQHGRARMTISRQDYTQEEIESTWITQEEYQLIRKSVVKQIFKLEAGQQLKDVKYCSRGLEGQTKLGCQARFKARTESIAAVLDIQEALCIQKLMTKSKSLSSFQARAIAIAANSSKTIDDGIKNNSIISGSSTSSNSTISTCLLDEYDDYEEDDDGDDDEKIAYSYSQTSSSCQLWALAVGQQDARAAEDL